MAFLIQPHVEMLNLIKSYGSTILLLAIATSVTAAPADAAAELLPCGHAYYYASKYTCYNGTFLCPIIDGEPTLRCGSDCYLPEMYSCSDDDELVYPPEGGMPDFGTACVEEPTTQQLSDPPYENYFYSDCHSSTQVVVTSPLDTSNLTIIGPRLLVAWPSGNSGAVAFFEPSDGGANGSLAIGLLMTGGSQHLHGVYEEPAATSLSNLPMVGVQAIVTLNTSAVLSTAILGSIRNIRDFTEGPSLLYPIIQDAVEYTTMEDGGVMLSRMWLDNITTTRLSFKPLSDQGEVTINNKTLEMAAGSYEFTAKFDYPQLTQLNGSEVLNDKSRGLIESDEARVTSLTFLSYSQKLLAGAWRFLTCFGRDSMIATLLLQSILSEGEGGAIEAVIGAVLERLNRTTGVVCHEETIGDYATYLNIQQKGNASTAPGCTYLMVDTDYFLAPLLENYFLRSEAGQQRREDFMNTKATLDFGNAGLTYGELILINAKAVMDKTAAFAQDGGQILLNLIHLEEDEVVGQWRDSTYGIGGGRIPYDVNSALVPAALRSIAALSNAGWFQEYPTWAELAAQHAQVWEDNTLRFFEVNVPAEEARALVENCTETSGYGFPSRSDLITNDVVYHGLALEGNNDQPLVKVMNTDDCFRLFLTNTTNQPQLTAFLNQTATNVRTPFPVGLLTSVSMVVANPAYGGDAVYTQNFTSNAYHGTVIWSWQLAMMAAGLQRQLQRCTTDVVEPEFCSNEAVHSNVLGAYNDLWDNIEANAANLNSEVWSWIYRDGDFQFEPLGALPPPAGQNPTESNIRQLWSLTFIAVQRDQNLR
ncbi:putative endo-1,3(4)-beta-glucanase 1, carbohydrate binding protein [Septoria linicola]|nr:putative endo-1,3(4)-beta-glucanase 1, carbohydrate binding protein [Septoria linicola]